MYQSGHECIEFDFFSRKCARSYAMTFVKIFARIIADFDLVDRDHRNDRLRSMLPSRIESERFSKLNNRYTEKKIYWEMYLLASQSQSFKILHGSQARSLQNYILSHRHAR